MRVLSIDVGIKNLSYCVLDYDDNDNKIRVHDWNNIAVMDGNCKKVNVELITEAVLEALMNAFAVEDDFRADYVIIENQPMLKNGIMKTVAVIIYTFFNMMKLQFGNVDQVKFVSAANKLKCNIATSSASTSSYKDRKKLSIQYAVAYIPKVCPDRLEWFMSQKKKDDCADSLLQGISFIEKSFAK